LRLITQELRSARGPGAWRSHAAAARVGEVLGLEKFRNVMGDFFGAFTIAGGA
jgi:hypothetical protein